MACLALFPFAVTLGLDLYIVGEKMAGTTLGVLAGGVVTGLALIFWYGVELVYRKERPAMESERKERAEPTQTGKKIEQMLTEARVILPGAQALFGFQLTVILAASFDKLPLAAKAAHAASIGCIAVSIILLMSPAAYHRIVYGGEDDPGFHRIGSRFVMAATVPLALGLSGDLYVVIEKIAGSDAIAVAVALIALAGLVCLWYIYPAWLRRRRRQGDEGRGSHDSADIARIPTASGGFGGR
jgi:hypothetical protein